MIMTMKLTDKMRFAALTHDLGKAFSRHRHEHATIAVLKMVMPINYMTMKSSG